MDQRIISFLNAINRGIDYVVAVFFVLLLAGVVVWYTVGRVRSYKKKGDDPAKGLFLGVIMLVEMVITGYIILVFPMVLQKASISRFGWEIPAGFIRWFLIFLILPAYFYLGTRKYSGVRGFFSVLTVLIISLFGWQFEHWIGVALISLPILGVLLYLLYHLAQVVLPSSSPENQKEHINKFIALLTYMFGVQFPVWVAKDSAGRDFEMRIIGNNFSGSIEPGIVWTYAHQTAGISAGIEFTRVEGPGIVFTKVYERPIALVDLRTQIRTTAFDAMTKDGITFKAFMFAAFVVDFDDWPKEKWDRVDFQQMVRDIQQNPDLKKGIKVDRKIGSYHYSTARIKSVLSTIGINTNPRERDAGPIIYWDEWTLKQIENAARQVLSQRTMNDLWHPLVDEAGTGALDEIAAEVRKIVGPKLRSIGINLFACRVVNFILDPDSLIRQQQIDSWKSLWSQRITAALSEAAAIQKEEIEKAKAYAKSEILDAIAESIEKARGLGNSLPRHLVALYYFHAIENIVKKRPGATAQEDKEWLDTIKSYLLYNQ
jgi:hypothetical protein